MPSTKVVHDTIVATIKVDNYKNGKNKMQFNQPEKKGGAKFKLHVLEHVIDKNATDKLYWLNMRKLKSSVYAVIVKQIKSLGLQRR